MPHHRITFAFAIAFIGLPIRPALAADTNALSAFSLWSIAPIAIGLGAVALALVAMHRMRLRFRETEAEVSESLRESERRYRAIVEDQSELICRWRPDGLHTYGNPAYCRSFGLSSEELLRTKVLDLIPEEDHAQVKRHWESLTPARPAGTHQHRVFADGNKIRLQEWTDRAVFDADGKVIAYQSVGRDITDRQQADERLRESEARFRTLSESAPIGIFRADAEGVTNFVNAHLLEISGLTLRESLGHGWMKVIHPDDIAGVHAGIAASRAQRKSFLREFRIVTTRNETRWIRVRTVWTEGSDGSTAEQVGTVEDITDEKRAIDLARVQRDLAADLGTTLHLGESLDLVLEALFRVSGFDAGAVHLIDGDTNDVHMLHSKGMPQAYISDMFHLPAASEMAQLIARGTTIRDDTNASLLSREIRQRDGLRSAVMIPVVFRGKTIGAILMASREDTRIPKRDLALLESISAQIGGAISRIRAIGELRAERDHSDRIIQGTPAIVCGFALDGTTLFVNPACERVTGYSADLIVGRNWWDTFYPGEERAQVDRLLKVIRKGDVRDYEMRMTARNGDKRIVSWSSIRRCDDNGSIVEIIGFGNDVTARRQAEDELRKFKTIADNMPHGQAISAIDGTLLYVNRAWACMHDYEPEDLVGRHLSIFHSQEQMPRVTELNERLIRDGSYAAQEVWHIRRDGTPFPTLMDAIVIKDENGRSLYLSGTASDITQIKQYEASLQRQAFVLNSINDAVYLTDAENRITYWNAAAQDIFDYEADEALGQSPSFLYHPYEQETLDDCIRTGLVEDGFWADEVRFCIKDGSEIVCETFYAPVRNEIGQWIGTVAVHRDITARKQSEQERERLRAQLHHSQKLEAVGTLACGVAHDFNNLLSAIFGHTHLAKSLLEAGHPALRSLDMVSQTAQQARGVISALLTFTRKSVALKKRMDVVHSVRDAIRLLRRLVPGSIEISEKLPERPLMVNGDDAQLKQIWMNLAVNARDAMPSGGRLSLGISEVQDDSMLARTVPKLDCTQSGFIRVRVEDTGCGMSPEVLSRVYEPFFTTKQRGEGTGLGMAVVLAIVEDHGGSMLIESKENKGTVVDVFLPLCRPSGQAALPQIESEPSKHEGAVLLCEDDSQIRSILTSSLRLSGFEVFSAPDSEVALTLLSRHTPDICLLVINFDQPKLDRAALLAKIHEAADGIPTIMITADRAWHPSSESKERERILRMPYQIEDLVCTINEVLQNA